MKFSDHVTLSETHDHAVRKSPDLFQRRTFGQILADTQLHAETVEPEKRMLVVQQLIDSDPAAAFGRRCDVERSRDDSFALARKRDEQPTLAFLEMQQTCVETVPGIAVTLVRITFLACGTFQQRRSDEQVASVEAVGNKPEMAVPDLSET